MYLINLEKNNITYSIDMLRLKTYISLEQFTKLQFRFETCWKDYLDYNSISYKYTDFRYTYHIKMGNNQAFWFGYMPNSEKKDLNKILYNFTIEFNPNKLKNNNVLLGILKEFTNWLLKSYDVACDVPISILDLCGFDKGRKKDFRIISEGFDNKTIYLGRRGSASCIKIYNKKHESDLDINSELTRIEFSVKANDYKLSAIAYYHSDFVIPELYTNDYLYTFKDYEDRTLLAILFAVQNGFEINMLTKTYKNKIKNLLKGGHLIKIEREFCDDILKDVINYYFDFGIYRGGNINV